MIVLMLLALLALDIAVEGSKLDLDALYSFYFKQTPSQNTNRDTEQRLLHKGAKYSAESQLLLFHRNLASLTAPVETPESEGD